MCREELDMMHTMTNQSQRSIFEQIISELELNSTAIVSGAAGTGKSFILRMLERHYRLQGYKVIIFKNIFSIKKKALTPSFCLIEKTGL